jgi:hypothetical protein
MGNTEYRVEQPVTEAMVRTICEPSLKEYLDTVVALTIILQGIKLRDENCNVSLGDRLGTLSVSDQYELLSANSDTDVPDVDMFITPNWYKLHDDLKDICTMLDGAHLRYCRRVTNKYVTTNTNIGKKYNSQRRNMYDSCGKSSDDDSECNERTEYSDLYNCHDPVARLFDEYNGEYGEHTPYVPRRPSTPYRTLRRCERSERTKYSVFDVTTYDYVPYTCDEYQFIGSYNQWVQFDVYIRSMDLNVVGVICITYYNDDETDVIPTRYKCVGSRLAVSSFGVDHDKYTTDQLFEKTSIVSSGIYSANLLTLVHCK